MGFEPIVTLSTPSSTEIERAGCLKSTQFVRNSVQLNVQKLEIAVQNPARRSHFGRFLVICNGFYTDRFILITNFGDPPRCTNLKIQWNGTFQPSNWDNDLKVASEGFGHFSKLTATPGHRLGVLKRFWRYFWKKTKIGHHNFDLLAFLSDLPAGATHPTGRKESRTK